MSGKHWKTTVAGIVAALAAGVESAVAIPEPWRSVIGLVLAGALAVLGSSAADRSKLPPSPR